jgi:hypothetical protein
MYDMDMKARSRLAAEIARQQNSGGEIAVPLELFFEGNDDQGSIGCNLGDNQPSIAAFHQTLAALQSKPEVQEVWVRIADSNDEDTWPYTDTVYVISSLQQNEIENALAELRFDEVTLGWMHGKPNSAPEPKAGFVSFSVWWD